MPVYPVNMNYVRETVTLTFALANYSHELLQLPAFYCH